MTSPHPTSAPTQFLTRPNGTIAYDVSGHGPLIIAVPGIGDLRQTYRFLVPLLLAAGHRVVTVDPRGQGESSARWDDYSPVAMGDDLLALIRSLNAGPAVILGNSYGGGAAVWAAAQDPQLVSGLVLIGAFVRDPKTSALQRLMMNAVLSGPWKVGGWLSYFATLFKGGRPGDAAEYAALLRRNLSEPGRFAALQSMTRASRAAIEARLGEVQASTLVVMGSADPDFPDPAAEAAFMSDALHGETALLEGAGHYPQAEMPAETADVILQFLAGQRGA